jgi:hypothetical protein
MFLRNVCIYLQVHTALLHSRSKSSTSRSETLIGRPYNILTTKESVSRLTPWGTVCHLAVCDCRYLLTAPGNTALTNFPPCYFPQPTADNVCVGMNRYICCCWSLQIQSPTCEISWQGVQYRPQYCKLQVTRYSHDYNELVPHKLSYRLESESLFRTQ